MDLLRSLESEEWSCRQMSPVVKSGFELKEVRVLPKQNLVSTRLVALSRTTRMYYDKFNMTWPQHFVIIYQDDKKGQFYLFVLTGLIDGIDKNLTMTAIVS